MYSMNLSPAVALTLAEQQTRAAVREAERHRLERRVRESDPLAGSVAADERRRGRRPRLVARLGL